MTNKQLGIIVGSIFLAVLLAYVLFVGIDFRSAEEKRYDEKMTEFEDQLLDSRDEACAEIERAGGECVD